MLPTLPISSGAPAPTAQRALFSTNHSNSSPNHQSVYVSVSLLLAPHMSSWGLSISMFEGRYLIIGGARPDYSYAPTSASTNSVRGFWAAHAPLNPSIFWNKQSVVAVTGFSKYLCQLPLSQTPRTLLPGDCILAIDGHPVSLFGNLSQATAYMREKRPQLSLLLLRHPMAFPLARSVEQRYSTSSVAAAAASSMGASPQYQAAAAVCRVYYRTMGPPSPTPAAATTATTAATTAAARTISAPSKPTLKPNPVLLAPKQSVYIPTIHTNPLFCNASTSKPLRYADDDYEFDPDEGNRAQLFLKPIDASNVSEWLQERKAQWRRNYKVYPIPEDQYPWAAAAVAVVDESSHVGRESCNVAVDFWSQQGYPSLQHWMLASTARWKQGYSWNQRKRKRLQEDSEVSVHLSTHSFEEWLRVRRNQWRILRRKRQRQQQQLDACPKSSSCAASRGMDVEEDSCTGTLDAAAAKATVASNASPTSVAVALPGRYEQAVARPELLMIDALLEEQKERELLDAKKRAAIVDISFLFDETLGCPDDVVTHCLRYLEPIEHGKLLCFSNKTRKALMKRDAVWRQLCPGHWTLPRRPRKPWYELYLVQLKDETQRQRKKWDDLLSQASNILFKADQLQSIEKLVTEAERDYGFDINYSSGIVCERNSLLNLAVIHQRLKVVKWLVEGKSGRKADIETSDRGCFTPLINAAWAGDRPLVRFLLQKGADRSKVGTGHYTKPLALPDFSGLTAAGWAEKRGFPDIAKLIRIGL